MASFSLRSQRTGRYKSFSLLEILKLLGDAVNDEILLEDGEDVYNLSSFRELGGEGSGNTTEQWSVEVPVNVTGLDSFELRYTPSSQNEVRLIILNGIVQKQDSDFSLTARAIKFPFRMGAQDSLQFIYPYVPL